MNFDAFALKSVVPYGDDLLFMMLVMYNEYGMKNCFCANESKFYNYAYHLQLG